MTLAEFTTWANGKKLAKYNDGKFPGQCVSLINQYCWRVLDVPADAWGDAKDWGSNTPTLKYFDRVSGKQAGDILVYPATATNAAGHIELYLGNGQSLQQNRFLDGTTHISPVWYKTPIAILRRKGTQVEKVNLATARILAEKILGRDRAQTHAGAYDKDLNSNHVGRDLTNKYIFDLWTSKESSAAATKIQADRDNLAKAQTQVTSLTQENADLKAQLAVQSEDTTNLNSLGTALQWFIKRLGLK